MRVITLLGRWVATGVAYVCFVAMSIEAVAGMRSVTIVLPSKATRIERFAAAELGKYLAAAVDAKAMIASGTPHVLATDCVFWVGNLTDDNRLAENGFPIVRLRGAKLIEDGICLNSDGPQTLLVGRGDRGALGRSIPTWKTYWAVIGPSPDRISWSNSSTGSLTVRAAREAGAIKIPCAGQVSFAR